MKDNADKSKECVNVSGTSNTKLLKVDTVGASFIDPSAKPAGEEIPPYEIMIN